MYKKYVFEFKNRTGDIFRIDIGEDKVRCLSCTHNTNLKPCKHVLAVIHNKELQNIINQQGVKIPESFIKRMKKF